MRTGKGLRWVLAAVVMIALGVFLAYVAQRAPVSAPPAPGTTPDSEPARAETVLAQLSDGDAAWAIIDPESVDELPPYKEVVPGRALVKVSEALRLGMAGDRVLLEVPQMGRTFEGNVESRNTDPYGNITYIGLLTEADGRDYRFIITAGARNTFAHVGTSRGTFELVASGELGWLMPTAGMDQHVDYSQPDYIIREEPPRDED